MKIAILNSQAPFIRGGAEYLADSLRSKLQEYGHQSEVIRIPFKWYPSQRILDHVLSSRLIFLGNVDRVIALKFPAYCVPHDHKLVWLLHQFRQAYDLWETQYQDIPDSPEGLRIRAAILQADNNFLKEARRIYTISKLVSSRLQKFNAMSSTVLYPPLINAESYYGEDAADYIFYPSRISKAKRQLLAIEAMKHVKSSARLVIAGAPDSPDDLDHLQAFIQENELEQKVQLIGKWIPDEEKMRLLAHSLACCYIPYEEDFGYVSLEAFYSKKPVITCLDSGGTLEFVEDGLTGYVVPSHPRELASAFDRLMGDRVRAAQMGHRGYDKITSMKISWDVVVENLVQ